MNNLPRLLEKQSIEKQPYRQSIFWDVDDVVLNTSRTITYILNREYNIPENNAIKYFKDIKDWGFRSIYKDLTDEQLFDIFESSQFWENVRISEEFLKIIHDKKILNGYNHYFVTKGTSKNLQQKETFLQKQLGKYFDYFEFIGLGRKEPKNQVDMSYRIQIDDNIKNLNTNAQLKILLTNGIETNFNNVIKYPKKKEEQVYLINDEEELHQILSFNLSLDKDDRLSTIDLY